MGQEYIPANLEEVIQALPTINALFHTGSVCNPKVVVPGFTQALRAYAKAIHVLKLLSNDTERGLTQDETDKLSEAAATLIDLANQKDVSANQKINVTVDGKYVPGLLLTVIQLSPHCDRATDVQSLAGVRRR